MDFMQYRVYCVKQEKEETLCKFWVNDLGEIDQENLPNKASTAELLQALRVYDVHVEFTGKIEDD